MKELILGKLSWHDLPHEWFTIGGTGAFLGLVILVCIVITKQKRWQWLWREWLTTVDPKKIGIMYFLVSGFMLLRGGLDAIMIWLQQAFSSGSSHGYLSADHFQQIFTAHGNIMVFFVAMGFVFGLINYIVPLQIGARDLASPFLNTLGFWLFVGGVLMVNMFFLFGGQYAATGWLAVAPLSGREFSPGVGVDYWIWSLQISGIGTTVGAINFIMTILKMRAPGMKLMKMPLFTWGSLCSMIMAVTVFPLLTATLFLVFFDRYLGTHFFTTTGGGDPMLYTNLIWMWGHPEVYILILPCFGVFSEVVATFSRKAIANYKSIVIGMIGVSSLALSVWLHHFFTMGAGVNVNAFFGFMTMIIAVPTTALVFTWMATMYKGRIRLDTPMLWFLGFVVIFALGGISGVLLAIPPIDFQLHNSLFLVAHFHSTVIGGVLFGIFCGINYWFPKMSGFRLNERIGRLAFWCWMIGFGLSFIPMYILGLMGATRRLDHYSSSTGWQPLFILMLIGGLIIMLGVALQFAQIIASIIERKKLKDVDGDPWNGRTLEWSVASPPPSFNFTSIPTKVNELDAFWHIKQNKLNKVQYEDILVPVNTASGIYISIFAFMAGFAFVWEIVWLAVVSLIGVIVVLISRTFNDETEYILPADKVHHLATKGSSTQQHNITDENLDTNEMGIWELLNYLFLMVKKIIAKKRFS